MSLQLAAQHLAQKGRGRDKMLVHMSPREVQGLQSLAKAKGGQLSINPETGLPEAGFLENLLPLVAAAAATYFTAGAATPMLMSAGMGATSAGILAGAGAGALIGGGSAAIQGGDVGQAALTGGIGGALSGALGAFGGGAETATNVGLNPNMPPSAPGLNPNAGVGATNEFTKALSVNAGTGAPIDPLLNKSVIPPEGLTPASYNVTGNAPTSTLTPTANQINSSLPGQNQLDFSKLRPGVPDSVFQDERAKQQVSQKVSQQVADKGFWSSLSPMQKAGISTAGAALTAEMAKPPGLTGLPQDEYDTRLKRISPNFRAQEPVQPNPYYRAQYAKEGGLMAAYQAGGPVERMSMANTAMNPQGGLYPQGMIDKTQYAMPIQRPVSSEMVMDTPGYERSNPMLMARGGIADLGGYSDGGRMLKGPGDGMSDSIPATIGGRQPARLADGEFVVPADVVSHLGNGSTDAGAKKLYAMMDRARQARTGKKKQAPAVNTDKFIPRMA